MATVLGILFAEIYGQASGFKCRAMNGCKALLAERKEQGDPVEVVIDHAPRIWAYRDLRTARILSAA